MCLGPRTPCPQSQNHTKSCDRVLWDAHHKGSRSGTFSNALRKTKEWARDREGEITLTTSTATQGCLEFSLHLENASKLVCNGEDTLHTGTFNILLRIASPPIENVVVIPHAERRDPVEAQRKYKLEQQAINNHVNEERERRGEDGDLAITRWTRYTPHLSTYRSKKKRLRP